MIDRILDKLGIELNDMQQDSMQAILHGNKDVVMLSPTGSGKTWLIFCLLPNLWMLADDEAQAMVVTPGRELALQSATVSEEYGQRFSCDGLLWWSCYDG